MKEGLPDANVVARPPHFDLFLQLVTPAEQAVLESGRPPTSYDFANKAYELEWGAARFSGTTDAQAVVREDGLDGAVEEGTLRLGEVRHGAFDASFSMPVRQVHTADRSPVRELERKVAMRLVNLGYLDTIDADPGSFQQAVACYVHRTPARRIEVPGYRDEVRQVNIDARSFYAVELFYEWPQDRAPLLRALLTHLKVACGEAGGQR